MSEQEKQDTTQDNKNRLADLEPIGEVVGGGKIGQGDVILGGVNTYRGTTSVENGRTISSFVVTFDRPAD